MGTKERAGGRAKEASAAAQLEQSIPGRSAAARPPEVRVPKRSSDDTPSTSGTSIRSATARAPTNSSPAQATASTPASSTRARAHSHAHGSTGMPSSTPATPATTRSKNTHAPSSAATRRREGSSSTSTGGLKSGSASTPPSPGATVKGSKHRVSRTIGAPGELSSPLVPPDESRSPKAEICDVAERPADEETVKEDELRDVFERPVSAARAESNMFCLKDEHAAQAVERALSHVIVSDPGVKQEPISAIGSGIEKCTGFVADEVVGRSIGSFVAGSHSDGEPLRFFEIVNGTSFGRSHARVELPLQRRDGSSITAAVHVSSIDDDTGQRCAIVCLAFDVSEQRKRGEPYGSNSKEEARLEQVGLSAESLLSSIAVIEPRPSGDAHRLSKACSGFCDLIGLSPDECENRHWACWLGPGSDRDTIRGIAAAMRKNEEHQGSLLGARYDGRPFWAFTKFMPLRQVSHGILWLGKCTSFKPGRIGKYHVGRVLGKGTSGVVRVGVYTGVGATGEYVAVKTLDCSKFKSLDDIDQVQGEVKIMETLNHPNVIKLHTVHFQQEKLQMHLIMDFAPGGSLDKVIHKSEGGRLKEPQAAEFLRQIVDALDFCHRRRVVHRDLKPENLLIDQQGDIKIADFGLSAVISPFQTNALQSQVGTPAFEAPEIIHGKDAYGPSVDMWSTGVILYEMITGKLPFSRTADCSLEKRICSGKYSVPSHVSTSAVELIKSLLTLAPEDRLTAARAKRSRWLREHGLVQDES